MRLIIPCFVTNMVPVDWASACIVPWYKGKDNGCECISFRGINLMRVKDNVYGRILIKIIKGTESI